MSSCGNNGIDIIFEDNHLLVVKKPVNIPTQKDKSNDSDMLTLLKEDIKKRYNKPGNVYLGLVHRLDRPVGGVMVFAKTSKAASRLSDQVRTRQFKKVYLAVVHGILDKLEGRLENYLLKDTRNNTVSVVKEDTPGGKLAVLDYKVEGIYNGFSLVKVSLHTGRPHQIRVQLANIGHPLYGDQKYGHGVNKPGQQIALWSSEIAFVHPVLKQEMIFSCEPPEVEPWTWFNRV
ncbi:MAG TPA: RNA pseudouridine synthase [Hungateiclostridium thermocellum]|jgi:23S rRNA pseudouridine1911/1915/1917 synthase|uniref:RNA pseudouridylate synthase n=2 Tax=Acetivibrio thermocellus TaxID=1515 RepID=A3DC38_ACET2|nr:RNA pseudouridine synthase [Acetivibrio thermocellus]CDG34956.1 ribosomal large subunit pseudouridine synthase D [Acetivibrio thermocellus BC1]ABN51517.1 pseudouridine synthase [Acetivibrio thermocellus ATCC 27405]ADU74997.1 pseudouridine synthase [Acetivibrio thermocellus DSM 1313]ALX08965.1 pseudouridine synthase [Acetivibrio thermocellus AD2]ANV76715.1 pseudouridine synthase [Acetivibrio thermocellus DSM 2360]